MGPTCSPAPGAPPLSPKPGVSTPSLHKPRPSHCGHHLPGVTPSPGVPISWGLPFPTSGDSSLWGAGVSLLGPHGTRLGSRALTGPAAGAERGSLGGGSLVGSAHSTDPHSRTGRSGPSRRK